MPRDPDKLYAAEQKIIDAIEDFCSEEISITRICEAAGVNRDTFYKALKKGRIQKAWDKLGYSVIMASKPERMQIISQKARTDQKWARLASEIDGSLKKTPLIALQQNFGGGSDPDKIPVSRIRADFEAGVTIELPDLNNQKSLPEADKEYEVLPDNVTQPLENEDNFL